MGSKSDHEIPSNLNIIGRRTDQNEIVNKLIAVVEAQQKSITELINQNSIPQHQNQQQQPATKWYARD